MNTSTIGIKFLLGITVVLLKSIQNKKKSYECIYNGLKYCLFLLFW